MNPTHRSARVAGLIYLIVVVTGTFNLGYVPSQLIVQGEVAATMANIVAAEPLFRLGIVAGLVCYTAFLFLPFALYRLLRATHQGAAVLMVALAVVSVPISFVNLLNRFETLSLLRRADYLQAFSTAQLQAQMMLSLDAYRNGLLVSEIFWGLWLLPFGYLVFKSGFLPRILGILLMMGCFGYLIDFFGSALFPGYAASILASYATLPASLGEIGTCLWLLIVGVHAPKKAGAPVLDTV